MSDVVARAGDMGKQKTHRSSVLKALAVWAVSLCVPASLSAQEATPLSAPDAALAVLADLQGPVGPATSRFVQTVVSAATTRGARIIVLRMDTPGGLSQSMREIIKTILGSPIPVATFVAPSGARAASAGTYILYASHVAAMAPGTNLGAATPIKIAGGLPLPNRDKPQMPRPDKSDESKPTEPGADDPAELKMLNDAVAYIRGLADLRGRNAEWAERAVRAAESLPVTEALEQGVIDLVAVSVPQLLERADGRTVDLNGNSTLLRTAGLRIELIEPSWQTQLLTILTNPNFAFILLMIGVYGLIFEFANPGSIGPGVIGVICLLIGLYALNLLPLDVTGLALLLLGVAFMVVEAFTPSFGLFGLAGLASFVLGASVLLDSDSPEFRLSWQVIAGTGITSAALLMLALGYALKAQRRAVTTGDAELLSATATVLEWHADTGYVQVRGERWRARSDLAAGQAIAPGATVVVTAVHGLELNVSRPESNQTGEKS